MSDAACSSTFFKATMALNLVLLIGNGLVLALLAFKLLKQRKDFEKLQTRTGTRGKGAMIDAHYEPVGVTDTNAKICAKVEQVKTMPEEGIYHVPQETAYINDNAVKKNLSYLEVTA